MAKSRVTQSQLAAELGVAQSTVARALAGDKSINSRTRMRVAKAKKKYGYRPSILAKGLLGQRTHTLGVLLKRYEPNHMTVFGGIEQEAGRRGYSVMLAISGSDSDKERDKVNSLLDRAVEGLIVETIGPNEDVYRSCVEASHPVVFFEKGYAEFASGVLRDEEHAGRIMTEYLASLGHRRIAYIGDNCNTTLSASVRGYNQALEAAGIPPDSKLAAEVKPLAEVPPGENRWWVRENGATAAEHLLSLESPPTAIVVAGSELAVGVLDVARMRGLNVPRDLSVGDLYGGYLSERLVPKLTEVSFPLREMGMLLANKVIGQLESPGMFAERLAFIHGELVVGDSTGPVCDSSRSDP